LAARNPGPRYALKPARCTQSLPADIPPGPNIPSKPVHHRSQHSKLKLNSVAEVLAVYGAGGSREKCEKCKRIRNAHIRRKQQVICEPTLCLFGLADSNSLRLPPPLQTLSQGWKKLSFG
ncbi:hypothetical protein BDZ91DRAFT_738494, partial [Kalaharituber pfeilii]